MKAFLTIIIITSGIGLFVLLFKLKPEAERIEVVRPINSVEIITVQPETLQLFVQSQGTLLPTIESDLIAEVSGRVIEVAETFRPGNRFSEGEVLLKIDPADYEAAAAAREAELANAELALAQEKAFAEQAAADWEALGEGDASELTLRKPQLKQASASVASAKAALDKAKRDLDRTQITAPFDGIVLTKNTDLGQFIIANPSNPIGRIYSTESAEVRLPITEQEASFLDQRSKPERSITLRRANDYSDSTWTARLARIEDNINPNSRLLYVVAQLKNPFNPSEEAPALRRGTFMTGTIEGRSEQNIYSLPRYALRGSETLYVLDKDNKLTTRKVSIVQSDAERIIIDEGLIAGDRVAISPIAYFVENMPVEVIETKKESAE